MPELRREHDLQRRPVHPLRRLRRCLPRILPAARKPGKHKGDETLAALYRNRYGSDAVGMGSAIIKDEDRCIRCGLCAERCPVDAVTMERFSFKEVLTSE